MTDPDQVKRAFRRRPERSWASVGQYTWVEDDDLDMSLHVHRVALLRPGRIRELLEHVSDWHAVPLARDRPLWEAHLVEGLEDGRSPSARPRHLRRRQHGPAPARRPVHRSRRPGRDGAVVSAAERARSRSPRPTPSWTDRARGLRDTVADVVGSVPALAGAGVAAVRDAEVALPYDAPPTPFNGPVSSARRFAGDSWPMARLRAVARRSETSSNDVAIAMCAGALRAYLDEHDALPDDPLVAMVPVSLEGTDPAGAAREATHGPPCSAGSRRRPTIRRNAWPTCTHP